MKWIWETVWEERERLLAQYHSLKQDSSPHKHKPFILFSQEYIV